MRSSKKMPSSSGPSGPQRKKKVVRFFKFVLEKDVDSGEMMLPAEFNCLYGHNLGRIVTVHVKGTGKVYEMTVRKSETGTKIFLCDGWPTFVEENCLVYGCFLVFGYYYGSSVFKLRIFKKSTMESSYKPNIYGIKDLSSSDQRLHRRVRVNRINTENASANVSKKGSKFEIGSSSNGRVQGADKTETGLGKQREGTFRVTLPSYLYDRCNMTIPVRSLSTIEIAKTKSWFLEFGIKQWEVTILVNTARRTFSAGWSRFVRDNKQFFGPESVLEFEVHDEEVPYMVVNVV